MRRKIKISCIPLSAFLLITIVCTFLLNRNQPGSKITVTESYFSLLPPKPVTKSLAELGAMDELNAYVLFFNRVPKCGSEILVLLLQWLQGWNNFKHVRLKGDEIQILKRVEQEELVYKITDVIRNYAVPLTFDQYLYFINFTSFDRQSPTFINLVRDPIEKILSRMKSSSPAILLEQCIKKEKSECVFTKEVLNDFSIPYFCGQDKRCTQLNNRWALQIAQSNVDRYYPVVGVLEELNATLAVFEKRLPYFFKGAQTLYFKNIFESRRHKDTKKPRIGAVVQKYLKNKLTTEHEFYEWIKSRLLKQRSEF